MEGSQHKFKEVGAEDIGLDRGRIDNSGEVEILREDQNKPLPQVPGSQGYNNQAHGQPGGPGQNLGSGARTGQNTGLSNTSHEDEHMGKREKLKEKAKTILHIGSNTAGASADRKSTRLNSSHSGESRMPSSA